MKRNELRAMLLEQPYDALVLTSEISRRYATGFHSTAGAVYLSAKQAVFFTDFRYVEAAHAAIKDFEVREIKAGQSYSALINELLDEDGAKKGRSRGQNAYLCGVHVLGHGAARDSCPSRGRRGAAAHVQGRGRG